METRRHRHTPSLGEAGANGITALRLVLAVLVALSHTFQVGAFGLDPLQMLGGSEAKIGTAAVLGFFALSGYLLAGRRERSGRLVFLRNRAARIFPGLWACLLITAFLLAPIGALIGHVAYDPGAAAEFVRGNAALQYAKSGIGALFAGNPLSNPTNVSLWTLGPEFLCYLVLAALPVRSVRPSALGILLAASIVHLGGLSLLPELLGFGLPVAFAIGVLLGSLGTRPGLRAAAVAFAAFLVATGAGAFDLAGPALLPVAVIGAGLWLPLRWKRDLSYGTYLYAFPIQQILESARLPIGPLPFFGIAIAITLGFAWLSWTVVERPVIGLFRARVGRPPIPELDALTLSVSR